MKNKLTITEYVDLFGVGDFYFHGMSQSLS